MDKDGLPMGGFPKDGPLPLGTMESCLMVVMYNRRATKRDWVALQCLCCVSVIYVYMLASTVVSNIVTVHKWVEIEMADENNPPHKFTDLCRKFMWLTADSSDGTVVPLLDIVIPILSRQWNGGTVVTYRSDNMEADELIIKIKRSAPAWFFGYWVKVRQYKLRMVQRLMERWMLPFSHDPQYLTQ
jgi:hypothetical protein